MATRPPEVSGLGLTSGEAERDLAKLAARFRLLRDQRKVFDRWQTLMTTHYVLGKNAHDARLVAAMQRHGVTQLLTFNPADFTRFPALGVLDAAQVGAAT